LKWNTPIDKIGAKASLCQSVFLKTVEAGWACCGPIVSFLSVSYQTDIRVLLCRVTPWTDQSTGRTA